MHVSVLMDLDGVDVDVMLRIMNKCNAGSCFIVTTFE
jgi:hypothetical protein